MYNPSKFKQDDETLLLDIVKKYPFATLITNTPTGIEATHLPVILVKKNGNQYIQAHIAKANKLWESVKEGAEILLTFNGPNCYISPNYYHTKKITGKAVPTWNYVAVHISGKISFIHNEKRIYNIIDALTKEHEKEQGTPWSISDAPETYINGMLSAIVGIEISIGNIQGKWKLSQNQPEVNKFSIVKGLLEQGEVEVSALVNDLIKS